MGTREIWIWGAGPEAEAQIAEALREGNLINPVRVIEDNFDFDAFFRRKEPLPLLLLLDLANARIWNVGGAVRKHQADERMAMIALVDKSTESLIDKAYDVGMKTYLRKPLAFSEFAMRAKLLNMSLRIERPDETNQLD